MNTPQAPFPPQQPMNMPGGYPYGQPGIPAQGMPSTPQPGMPPFGYPPQQPEEKKKKKKAWIWILILFIVIIIVACLLAFYMCDGGLGRDRNGELGQLEGKSEAEIQEMLNKQVEEGMFNIAIASYIELENGSSPADWEIENIPGNRYLMQVTVTRDDNGQVIYETGIIDPNYHIQRAPLDYNLPKGIYECTAVFTALDPETEEPVGQAGAKLTIEVKS